MILLESKFFRKGMEIVLLLLALRSIVLSLERTASGIWEQMLNGVESAGY